MIRTINKDTGNPVSSVPRYTLNNHIHWQINEAWDFNTSYTRYGKQVTASRPENFMQVIYTTGESLVQQSKLGSYGIWNANIGYNWKNRIQVRVGVNNVLDKRIYRNATTARTYNERGRAYFANVKYSF